MTSPLLAALMLLLGAVLLIALLIGTMAMALRRAGAEVTKEAGMISGTGPGSGAGRPER